MAYSGQKSNTNRLVELLNYFLLIFSVLLGAGLAYLVRDMSQKYFVLALAFSGAFLLGITVLHLLPGIFKQADHQVGIWILVGFLIQLILEFFSGGLEHGHIHSHEHNATSYLIQILFGLCIHSFMEGLPLDLYSSLHEGHDHGDSALLFGIVLHKIPAAFALALFIIQSKLKKIISIGALLLFAFSSPLGAFVGSILPLDEKLLNILLAIVVGSFLHIATVILFENEDKHHHKFSWSKLIFILLGFGIAILTT